MRANEFVVEKSNTFDKIGNWANKQVIDRKALDKAKVRKKNVPEIAKQLHQILAAKASKLANNPDQIKQMVIDTLSKSLRVNVAQHNEEFGNSVEKVIAALTGSPASIQSDGMFKLVQDVVDKSFDVGDQRDDDEEDEVEPEIEPEVEPEPEEPKAENSETVADLIDALKDYMIHTNPEDTMKATEADRRDFIRRELVNHGIKDEEQQEDVIDELMNDTDMPFNLALDPEFRGLVYSPKGTRHVKGGIEENIAFVKSNDKWSQWAIGPNSTWKYKEVVSDRQEIRQLESLARATTGDVIPMTFRQDETGGVKGMYKVSSR